MRKFKEGDRVIYTSNRFGCGPDNPCHRDWKYKDVVGTIYRKRQSDEYFTGGNWIHVKWSNGGSNSYHESDLEKVKSEEFFNEDLFEL